MECSCLLALPSGLEVADVSASDELLTVRLKACAPTGICPLCAHAGVAVVFVQELPNTGISGSTQWLTPTKALVQLSLRYKTDDQLWFTFFHEAGHILAHGKRQVFLETDQKDREEERMGTAPLTGERGGRA